jgi:hypothetical protein
MDPDPLARGMDPAPDPVWILLSLSKNSKKNLDFLPFKIDVKVPSKSNMQKNVF